MRAQALCVTPASKWIIHYSRWPSQQQLPEWLLRRTLCRGSLSWGLGALLMGFLTDRYGFNANFVVCGVLSVAWVALFTWYIPRRTALEQSVKYDAARFLSLLPPYLYCRSLNHASPYDEHLGLFSSNRPLSKEFWAAVAWLRVDRALLEGGSCVTSHISRSQYLALLLIPLSEQSVVCADIGPPQGICQLAGHLLLCRYYCVCMAGSELYAARAGGVL